MVPLNWKLRLSYRCGCLKLLMPLNQEAEKEVILQDGMIDFDYQEEIGLPLENEDKKNYVCNAVGSLCHLLVCPCPTVNVKVKLQKQTNKKSRIIEDSDRSSWPSPITEGKLLL